MNYEKIQSPQADGSGGERMSAQQRMDCTHDNIQRAGSFLVCDECHQVDWAY